MDSSLTPQLARPGALAPAASGAPLEIVSTCQVKTASGAAIALVALRAVGAPPAENPLCHLCLLPANGAPGEPSSHDLRAVALQCDFRAVRLVALDREVVYFVSAPGEDPRPVIADRGESFEVPGREGPDGAVTVTLTFEGDYCTLEARPAWPPLTRLAEPFPPPPPPWP